MSGARLVGERIAAFLEKEPPARLAQRPGFVWMVVGTTCIGAFIGQLDASIVQLVLPVLEAEFRCGLGAASWVAIAYLLSFAAALAPFTRLSQTTGRKRFYILGFLLFAAASALCALADSLASLVACRVLQGIGGALLGANSVTLLVAAAGKERRGRAMGWFAAAQALGVGVGPAVGGWLMSEFGWRSVFWVTVPFGLAGALAAWVLVPPSPPAPAKARFDWMGTVLLGPGLVALLLVLSLGHAWGLTSGRTLIAAGLALILLIGFGLREGRTESPLIRLSLLRIRDFSAGLVGITLSYALLYGMFFLMSYALVRGGRLTPVEAGLHLAILPVALGMAAPFSGSWSERRGARGPTLTGMACCGVAVWLLREVLGADDLASRALLGSLALYGVGLGLFISPNNSATLAAAPPADSAMAGGLLNLFRVLGTSIGVATASSVLTWCLAGLASGTDPFPAVAQALILMWVMAVVAAMAALSQRDKGRPA
jgi:EmrB/QacA subfamily drug resistance transporter